MCVLIHQCGAKSNDQKRPLPQIAKELGVNMIVHGLVQGGSGNQLRIVVKLENMESNQLQWSQEFSGMSGDLLTLEDQIYSKLVDALKVKATPSEMSVAGAHPTENVAAYDIYLHGRQALRGQQDPKNIQTAIDLFEQAIKKDSGFALAYTGLSDASMLMYREKKDRFWSERGIAAAKQAERLNGKLPEVHLSLGSAYSATGQTTEAISELKKALELSPNSDEAYRRLGNAYSDVGQNDAAIQTLKKAEELNPYYWVNLNALGTAYFVSGDYEKALKQFQNVTQLEPENAAGYDNMGSVYSRLGKYEDSIVAFQKALQIQPYAGTYSNLATDFFYLKKYPEAVQMFERAVEMNPGDETYAEIWRTRTAGRPKTANTTYDKAISLAYKQLQVNPRDANTMGHMALYYAKKGDSARQRVHQTREKYRSVRRVLVLYFGGGGYHRERSEAGDCFARAAKRIYGCDIEAELEFAPPRPAPEIGDDQGTFSVNKKFCRSAGP